MKRLFLLSCLGIAACSPGATVTAQNASVEEVTKQVAEAQAGGQFIDPGRWEARMTIEEIDIPGMPPEAAAQMKAHSGQARTIVTCLTPEAAKKPAEGFFAGGNNGNCRYDSFQMGGGKIDATMTCGAQGAAQTMTMAGTYSPGSYTMRVATKASGDGDNPMAKMSMRMTMDGKRTGACTGDEINKGESAR